MGVLAKHGELYCTSSQEDGQKLAKMLRAAMPGPLSSSKDLEHLGVPENRLCPPNGHLMRTINDESVDLREALTSSMLSGLIIMMSEAICQGVNSGRGVNMRHGQWTF